MGPNRSRLILFCLMAATACLVYAYALANLGLPVPAVFIVILTGWLIRWPGSRWLPSALLVLYLGEAAGGVLAGASPAVMIAGIALMLMSWELTGRFRQQDEADMLQPGGSFSERSHICLLVLSIGIGLVLAEAGLLIHLQIPFIGLMLAGLLVIFSLYKFIRTFSRF